MTFAEMRSEVELLYESINSSAAPGFTTAEWGLILTVAQRKVVLDILEEGVNKNAFNQLAIERLLQSDNYTVTATDSHFKNSDGTAAQTINTGTKVFDSKFFWLVDEYGKTASINNIPLKRITFDFYRINIDNPFRTPTVEDGFWLLQYNNKPVFITDGTALTNYYLIGCHHPDLYPIATGTDCILGKGIHYKIVEKAVALARMSVENVNGYQLTVAENAM